MTSFIHKIFSKERGQNPRAVPLRTLMKGTAIIMVAPMMMLGIFVVYEQLEPHDAILGAGGLFIISMLFVWPYIANLSALTYYVEQLALDKKQSPPDLTFLNNVEELSEAVERLQDSWNNRKNQLESMVTENKVVIDSLPDILIMLDRNLNVLRTNSTAQFAFGKHYKETVENILETPSVADALGVVMENKEGQTLEFSLQEPISRDYIIRIERLPSFSSGGIAIVIAMHDVTQLKRTEQTFADFVANASHEIRTPLTSLMGFIETLQTTAKNDPKTQEKFLQIMSDQAEKMSRLVKDLLSLSKIEKSSRTAPTGKAKVGSILKEVIKQAEWEAKEKKVKIEFEKEKNLPEIRGDREELVMVFSNLLSNALKYGKKKSTVTINAKVEENTLKEHKFRSVEKLLTISFTDQGEGIPKKDIPRLTERFYRAEGARSRKIEGSGLGLSIASHILERHNGILKIESEKGKGSTFTVILPV